MLINLRNYKIKWPSAHKPCDAADMSFILKENEIQCGDWLM